MAKKARAASGKAPSSPPRRRALPRPGDPYVTASGKVIPPDSNSDIGFPDPRPMDVDPKDFRSTMRLDMDELLAGPREMNACACVLAYTMLGISDREIMLNLKITEDQLVKIREHEAYAQVFEAFRSELINVNSASLSARIAGYAHSALDTIAHLHLNGKKEDTRLKASQDIMDRAGTKVADQTARQQGKPVGLRITVTEENGTTVEMSNVSLGV